MYKVSPTCQVIGLNDIYVKHFGYPSKGVFVEIGANDGEFISNTSCLADHGWRGIYVEPIKEYYKACVDRHKNNNVDVVQCCIGIEETEIDIYYGGPITTTDIVQVKRYLSMNWARKELYRHTKQTDFQPRRTDQIRLDTLLNRFNINAEFDLLVVDVEGTEDQVINSFDLSIWMPKMLIVELEDMHKSFQIHQDHVLVHRAIRDKINRTGYQEIYQDEINTIFVRKA